MKLIRALCIAFSFYSRIPAPRFPWNDEDMKYIIIFFPWIGAVVGALFTGWYFLCQRFQIGGIAYTLFGMAIPMIVVGGFHIDGFMDTMDAIHSYAERKRKFEILFDSCVGAFAVIMFVLCGLIYGAALSEICTWECAAIAGIGFVLSRTLSGIGIITLKSAGQEDSMKPMQDTVLKKVVLTVLIVYVLLCAAGMIALSPFAGLLSLAGAFLSFLWYRHMAYREFGGITGDTAGCFVVVCETVVMVTAAIGSHLWG